MTIFRWHEIVSILRQFAFGATDTKSRCELKTWCSRRVVIQNLRGGITRTGAPADEKLHDLGKSTKG
jgi:hypothetical protein